MHSGEIKSSLFVSFSKCLYLCCWPVCPGGYLCKSGSDGHLLICQTKNVYAHGDYNRKKKWFSPGYFYSMVLKQTLLILMYQCNQLVHSVKNTVKFPTSCWILMFPESRIENFFCPFFLLVLCLFYYCSHPGASYISLIWKWFTLKKECQWWL